MPRASTHRHALTILWQDLGDCFSTILKGFTALSKSISPLCGITLQLNYETEVPAKKELFQRRESPLGRRTMSCLCPCKYSSLLT